ncbi:MAG: ACP S-malonyltransferase [Termitinemataceae bacterium]|nr:MAG: ACP S-malonyltransferase [Termitinemataceae bacterium]
MPTLALCACEKLSFNTEYRTTKESYNVEKIAFLFPGQGVQSQGMGVDLLALRCAAELFELSSGIMGRDMKKLLTDSDEEALKETSVAQPAITLVNLAAAAVLQSRGIAPFAAAGHSLGEYSALCTAGLISAETCFKLVKERGALMQCRIGDRDRGEPPFMAAVLGIKSGAVEDVVKNFNDSQCSGGGTEIFIANYNSSKQTVVSGTALALQKAEQFFKAAGARRFLPLKVAGPFHSPLMADAEKRFAAVLNDVEFAEPKIAFFSNVSGGLVKTAAQAKELLMRQITSSVHWTDEERAIASCGIQSAMEVGYGRVLCGLWEQEISGIPCHPAGTLADIENIEILEV